MSDPRDEGFRLAMCLAIGLVAAGFYYFVYLPAAWDECRRVHPEWYCIGELGKR